MITFSKKWFNPLYFILNEIGKDDKIRTVLVYGGKSSSKTVSISQWLSKQAMITKSSTIAYRKQSNSIDTTLKKSFNLGQEMMRIDNGFKRLDKEYRCINGAEIVLKGIDTEEKAKGIESFKYLFLDELNHFTYLEYEQFQLSLRGIRGQKVFAAWNPVDEYSWVKTDLVDRYEFTETNSFGILPSPESFVKISDDGKVVLIKTTYLDNYWIVGSPCGTYGFHDENLISEYTNLKNKNYNSYRVNVLGEWGKTEFGGEFLKKWKSEVHVGSYPYNPELALTIVFDENVNPYFPCAFFQIVEDNGSYHAKMVKVLAMKNPDNTTTGMIREIRRILLTWDHKEPIFIGGDATSVKNDVKMEKGHDLFRIIQMGLTGYRTQLIVPQSNPSVTMSGDFVNSILDGDIKGIRFNVDEYCRIAINDFENTKEDKNGKIDKKTVTDPMTKISYQPFGHFVDIVRYFFTQKFAREYQTFQRGSTTKSFSIGKNSSKHSF